MNDKIFISIPAYEDKHLVDTIHNLIDKAKFPENLVFGLSLKYENEPDLSFIKNKLYVLHKEDYDVDSPGIVQIRSKLRSLITDEKYFLGIDAHTDIDQNWDEILISDLEELHSISDKFIISKQLIAKNNIRNYYTKWRMFEDRGLKIYGNMAPDYDFKIVNSKEINDKYFINRYASGNFIFGNTEFIRNTKLPDYHKYPYEESELAIVLFCNGYDLVAPKGTRCPMHAGNDSKYDFPYDERWWSFIGTDRNNKMHWEKKWNSDTLEMSEEVIKLMLTGKNKYFSLIGLQRTVDDFFNSIGLEQEQEDQKKKRSLQ